VTVLVVLAAMLLASPPAPDRSCVWRSTPWCVEYGPAPVHPPTSECTLGPQPWFRGPGVQVVTRDACGAPSNAAPDLDADGDVDLADVALWQRTL